MLIRASLNYVAHMAAGLAFGALTVMALSRLSARAQTHARGQTGSPALRGAPPEAEGRRL